MTTFRDPITGRRVSESTYYARAFAYELETEAARDRLQRAADKLLDARSRRSQSYWQRQLDRARESLRESEAISHETFTVIREAERERTRRARAAKKRKTTTRRAPAPKPTPKRREPRVVRAREWEFGKKYEGTRGANHAVAINARLVFSEGVTEAYARDAMRQIIDGASPDEFGAMIDAVDWQTPRGRLREGDGSHFDSFRAIFYTSGVDYLRVGAVKDDVL